MLDYLKIFGKILGTVTGLIGLAFLFVSAVFALLSHDYVLAIILGGVLVITVSAVAAYVFYQEEKYL